MKMRLERETMYEARKTGEVSKEDQKLLDIFAQDAFAAVEVSADDLVTVKMSSRFELTDVSIRDCPRYKGRYRVRKLLLHLIHLSLKAKPVRE